MIKFFPNKIDPEHLPPSRYELDTAEKELNTRIHRAASAARSAAIVDMLSWMVLLCALSFAAGFLVAWFLFGGF